MLRRGPVLPIFVVWDTDARTNRCVNALYIQTFIPNPYGDRNGTLITFVNGDYVTVENDFDEVIKLMRSDRVSG